MKVAVVAFSIKGAMGQYLHAWLSSLGEITKVTLFSPLHYEYTPTNYSVVPFKTSNSRARAAVSLMNPVNGIRLWRTISSSGCELVHIFNGEGYPWSLLGASYLKRKRIPFVTTIHDVLAHSDDLYGRVFEKIRSPVIKRSSLIHVHSRVAAKQLSEKYCFAGKVAIIPHGNIAPIFTPYMVENVRGRKTILFFGRIEAYKGIDTLVSAMRYLPADVQLIIAGPGRVDQLLTAALTDSRIEFKNRYLSNREVGELLSRANVCVLPYKDATQSSLPALCAAFNVPVVATSVGSFTEDIPAVGGMLVPPGDSKALALAIKDSFERVPTYPKDLDFDSLRSRFLSSYASAVSSVRNKGT